MPSPAKKPSKKSGKISRLEEAKNIAVKASPILKYKLFFFNSYTSKNLKMLLELHRSA